MIELMIDGSPIQAESGTTLLDVAKKIGIAIPSLCHVRVDDCTFTPTSCQVCLVKVAGRIVPACATVVADGMVVESETAEVIGLRRIALELLLSEHRGNCYAPCQWGCPAKLDIPAMVRVLTQGDFVRAKALVEEAISLPLILGKICPRPCEKVCLRRKVDKPIAICELKCFAARQVAKTALLAPLSGKSVLVVGAGPIGLTIAWHLARAGHKIRLCEKLPLPGGRLLKLDEAVLPAKIRDEEIQQLLNVGNPRRIDFRSNTTIPWANCSESELADANRLASVASQSELKQFDAVVIATGRSTNEKSPPTGREVVQEVAQGRRWAIAIDRFLNRPTADLAKKDYPRGKPLVFHSGNSPEVLEDQSNQSTLPLIPQWSVRSVPKTVEQLLELETAKQPITLSPQLPQEAADEVSRCLHCDCRGRDKCRLLQESDRLNANPRRFEPSFASEDSSCNCQKERKVRREGGIVYESQKCIQCGACVLISSHWGASYGFTHIGRGFDLRIDIPFGKPLDLLGEIAQRCAEACPTGALYVEQRQ